jgi:hypothetical protein
MKRDTLVAALCHLHYESGFTPDSVVRPWRGWEMPL